MFYIYITELSFFIDQWNRTYQVELKKRKNELLIDIAIKYCVLPLRIEDQNADYTVHQ